MKIKNFKVLSIVLALVMVLGLTSVAVFADWPSFQNTNTNNGVITTAPPLDNPKTVLRVGLPTNDPYNLVWGSNSVFTGVDAASVIKGGKAYTIYNGGVSQGSTGGARLGIVDLATGNTNSIQISAGVSNGFLISTPVIAGSDIYAAITSIVPFDTSPRFNTTNWTNPPPTGFTYTEDVTIDPYTTGEISTNGTPINFAVPTSTFTIETTVSANGAGTDPIRYAITLISDTVPAVEYPVVPSTLAPVGMGVSVVTYNGATIPAGNYKIRLWMESYSQHGRIYDITFNGNGWGLYKIKNFATNPEVSLVRDNNYIYVAGQGQANTPITYDDTYLYWGIYGGTKSYYQFKVSDKTLTAYAPVGTEFYGAGAAYARIGSDEYVVFGSDSGNVHVRPVGANFGNPASGNTFSIGAGEKIRSSIAIDSAGEYAYFTSNNGTSGKVHKIEVATLLAPVPTVATQSINYALSTSTPVISDSGNVYFGVHTAGWPSYGGVIGTQASSFSSLFSVYGNALSNPPEGDPVQASPIVYSYNGTDYIYFTTNSGSGKGYCCKYDGLDADLAWQAGGASGNRYSMQGFASDDGYLVYGDDGGMLYIIK